MSVTDRNDAEVGATDEESETPPDIEAISHVSDWKYIQIAIILAVITAAEVATYYIDTGPLEVPLLIAMMIAKFVLVIMWFMHLKFDSPLFTRTFVAGLAMAVVVYIAVLSMFEFWA
ncbi:MAG: cytochrome C oxidase subunit IV family protein [Acidimicrobiales bacterium]|nr:cytochrome C oxidase subunit IV family protein [Acidimicrobiales bacterium]MCB9374172.1 cytochrome C oxidase subunit IV family protein [Microthrixaceae bacterium]